MQTPFLFGKHTQEAGTLLWQGPDCQPLKNGPAVAVPGPDGPGECPCF